MVPGTRRVFRETDRRRRVQKVVVTVTHRTKRVASGVVEAGVDGAKAGIIMPVRPRVGMQYQQEHYAGHAEDMARVLGLDEQAEVPAGHFEDVRLTREWNPLEPAVLEYKLYAKGVGPVLAVSVSGGGDREELLPQ